jgi:hypothetical protein
MEAAKGRKLHESFAEKCGWRVALFFLASNKEKALVPAYLSRTGEIAAEVRQHG